jgi:asparagine synthase (glutamine-hydrolysing)
MSAIAGIYHINQEPVKTEYIHAMMSSFAQFPADDIRVFKKDHIFLGCHAQWITPESLREILPYFDKERRLSITADAIIDNRQELIEMLSIKESNITDSELILLSYDKWEEDCPKYLIGDFAFMIWDEKNQRMFGARDFAGSRTLYYSLTNQRFAFATTVKPLLSLPYINKAINEEWIAEFLVIPDMFNTVDIHSTVYKNIQQVPPSHSITIQNGKVKLARYITFDSVKKLKLSSNFEYEEAFREVFQRAVSDRLRTYKNVGSQLSGGLDSGSVVSFASKELQKQNKQLHTFSYIPVEDFVDWTPRNRIADERPFIRSTIGYVGNIQAHYLDFKDRTPLTEIDEWLHSIEMPYKFFNNSYWMRGIYEKASYQNIGLLLNGARGNWTISFGSAIDYYSELLKKMKLLTFYKEVNHYCHYKKTGRKDILKRAGRAAFPLFYSSENNDLFPLFINEEFAKKTNVFNKIKAQGLDITGSRIPGAREARDKQFQKLFYWGNGTSGTKFSLRYGLWNRDPTNDLRVIKFCLALPDSQFVQNGIDRSLIRRATENYLPRQVRQNHQFRGAQGVDSVHRMRSTWNELMNEVEIMLKDSLMEELTNIDILQVFFSKIKDKPRPEYALYTEFKILMRSLIMYRFLKNRFERR